MRGSIAAFSRSDWVQPSLMGTRFCVRVIFLCVRQPIGDCRNNVSKYMPFLKQHNLADDMLMARFQRGDVEAFAQLLQRHSNALFNYLVYFVGDVQVAAQLLRSTLLEMVQIVPKLKHDEGFAATLFGIARGLAVQRVQRGGEESEAGSGKRQSTSVQKWPVAGEIAVADTGGPTNTGAVGPDGTLDGADVGDALATANAVEAAVDLSELSAPMQTRLEGRTEDGNGQSSSTSGEDLVVMAFASLALEVREAVLLRELANLRFEEIAKITNSSACVAKARVKTGLEQLRLGLQEPGTDVLS